MTQKKHGRMHTIDVVICGLFAALIAVGAFIRITIPTQPYPFTFSLQWLFVLLAGLVCLAVFLSPRVAEKPRRVVTPVTLKTKLSW